MKKLALLLLVASFHTVLVAQDSTQRFPVSEFNAQFEKLICAGKNDFAELIDKQVIVNGDTSWKTKLTLPGFKFANFSKSRTMIDYAFVAYHKFDNREEANKYYQEVKNAINLSLRGDCIKLEPARIPMQVQGVEQYDLWKSSKNVPYNNLPSVLLYVSLSLDKENEVVVNVFLK